MTSVSRHDPQIDFPRYYPPTTIRILGAGHFGRHAAERLTRRFPHADFLAVDLRSEKIEAVARDVGLPVRVEDALSYLLTASLVDNVWVIPAVPLHVALRWTIANLAGYGHAEILPVPETVDAQVPNPYRMESGTLYASFATFICPDTCNEPDEICTHTREPRRGNLFQVLEGIRVPDYKVVVVRSWQLAPGVGGYPMGYLRGKLAEIQRQPASYLMATSCRCHGVIDAFAWKPW